MTNYSWSDLLGKNLSAGEMFFHFNLDINSDFNDVKAKMIDEFKKLDGYYEELREELREESLFAENDTDREEQAEEKFNDIFSSVAREIVNDAKQKNEIAKYLRLKSGLTQQKCAELTHANIRTWQRWEAGDREIPESIIELFCIKSGQNYDKFKC